MELFSPVIGHTFLPPDRIFGLTEQAVRKMEVIYHPKVVQVGKDYQVIDWKLEKDTFMKQPAKFHFQLGTCRRIILKTPKKGM